MGRLLLVFSLLFGYFFGFSQHPERFSQVKIALSGGVTIDDIAASGIPLEHSSISKNHIITVASETDIAHLQTLGIPYTVVIPDMAAHYRSRSNYLKDSEFLHCNKLYNDTIAIPNQFNYGSMGDYLTYDELLEELDSMALLYPNLITVKQPIDTFLTYEGRPIYYVKISDNATLDESASESQVLYTALHHAREPVSMMQLVFYMQYLLENYGNNEKVNHIIDNMELFFVPCVNPDGYVYNETTDPSGGGMWRKNRRDHADGNFGVDVNRNYGEDWGIDNVGSSPFTWSSTYRGSAPFSEPETRSIAYLCEQHSFKASLNYHAYSNILVCPDGYQQDSLRYVSFANHLTQHNHYTYGTGEETLGYSVNGDADVWMYKEEITKQKQYSFTPEIGNNSDGFWPPKSRIIPLCQENLLANINTALLVEDYVNIYEKGNFSIGREGSLKLDIQRIGLDAIGSAVLRLLPNPYMETYDDDIILGSFSDLETKQVVVNYKLKKNVKEGVVVPFQFELLLDDATQTKIISKIYNTQQPVLSEKFDVIINNWILGQWGATTEDFVSHSNSITDSPFSNYLPNHQNELILNKSINLTSPNYVNAYIKFYVKWDIENGRDYAQLIVNDGIEDYAMCGNYTNNGVAYTGQPDGEPLYDGIQKNWVEEYISLREFMGKVITIKIVMNSDNTVERDGMYIDNFRIYAVEQFLDGTEDLRELNRAILYPNPAANTIYINRPDHDLVYLQLIDAYGKLLLNQHVASAKHSVDIAFLPAGMYSIMLSHSNGRKERLTFIKKQD